MEIDTENSTCIAHEPCPECGSRDNLARYSDGHGFCFGCGYYEKADEMKEPDSINPFKDDAEITEEFIQGEFKALTKRGIHEDTIRKFNYKTARHNSKPCHVANYYEGSKLVGQKLRYADKTFQWVGSAKKAGLFGQNLWREGGKLIVVTEGELDALSMSQVQGNKWPVVSVKNGAQGAKKDIQRSLEFLEGYESVIFMFDMDEAGQKAAEECATILTPGKAKIATLPLKDANEMLTQGKHKELITAMWEAKTFRPDGIVSGAELWDIISTEDIVESVEYPYAGLNEKTKGLRKAELTTITAGSGIGKSNLAREIGYHLIKKGESVGFIMLEETVKRTSLGLMGLHLNKPLHLGVATATKEEMRDAYDTIIGNDRTYFYDSFGSTAIDNLLNRVRFLSQGCDCSYIILDHLSIVVSGLGDGDERRLIDNAMTALRTLVQETGVGLILVSHLKRPGGDKGHEEGAQTSLSQLRGSHAIAQLSDMVIGLERNQQGEKSNTTTVRVLKNRFSGETGVACHVQYNPQTGRLLECNPEFDEVTEDEF